MKLIAAWRVARVSRGDDHGGVQNEYFAANFNCYDGSERPNERRILRKVYTYTYIVAHRVLSVLEACTKFLFFVSRENYCLAEMKS